MINLLQLAIFFEVSNFKLINKITFIFKKFYKNFIWNKIIFKKIC